MIRNGLFRAANAMGRDPASIIDMTIDQIVEAMSVSSRTAYKIRRQASQEFLANGASESLKQQVLELVTQYGRMNDIEAIQRRLDGRHSPQDVTKAIWALQKLGELTFYERKHGGGSLLTGIQLSKGVRHRAQKAESKRRHPVGKDMTEPRHHRNQTTGGPIERVIARPGPVTSRGTATVFPRYSAPEPPPQNMKPVIDEGFKSPPQVAHAEDIPIHALADVNPDTHTQYPDEKADASEWMNNYPLIADLMTKQSRLDKYEAAAALLEETDAEMALALLEKIQLTDLEKEVIRFAQSRV